jgi:phenylpyruvate tautomerase PptA (4-oxalocrotonate tautomerase family)
MPILEVEIVVTAGGTSPQGMASAIANAAAAVFRSPKGGTWVRLHELVQECYSENGGDADPDVQPVFVRVLKSGKLQPAELQAEVAALTAAVALACDRPVENVHVTYDPPAEGRAAFGGKLLRVGGTGDSREVKR